MTVMKGATVHWCSYILTDAVQIADALMVPRPEMWMFSKDPDKRAT